VTSVQEASPGAVLSRVKGQDDALQVLRGSLRAPLHAYLFIGPRGTGRREAAVAFAAGLLCPNGGCGECASCRETLAGRHPDLTIVERAGASIAVSQSQEVARMALRTPRAGRYQVLVLVDFDLAEAAVPVLLKTIEEPPASTVIIVIAETIPRSFVTIASRCLKVPFKPLGPEAIIEMLLEEGASPQEASAVAEVCGGRLDRARLLVRDPGFAQRLGLWRSVPSRLDGTGARVAELAEELLASTEEPLAVVRERQAEELHSLEQQAAQLGEKAIPGRSDIDERHKRELRRVRTDELRAGLDALLGIYRDRATAQQVPPQRLRAVLGALEAIEEASSRLSRNVNETMLLQWLLLRLDT